MLRRIGRRCERAPGPGIGRSLHSPNYLQRVAKSDGCLQLQQFVLPAPRDRGGGTNSVAPTPESATCSRVQLIVLDTHVKNKGTLNSLGVGITSRYGFHLDTPPANGTENCSYIR